MGAWTVKQLGPQDGSAECVGGLFLTGYAELCLSSVNFAKHIFIFMSESYLFIVLRGKYQMI